MADAPAPEKNAPESTDLIAAHRAFERGDFYEARRLAVELERAAADEATRAAAQAILRRTSIDPVIVWLSAGCALFFAAVLILTLGR